MADRNVNLTINVKGGTGAAAGTLGGSQVAGVVGGKLAIAGAGGVLAVVAEALVDFGKKVVETGVSLAKMANPAQAELFNLAMLDALSVIGHRFLPVLELMTEGMMIFGDFLASVLPSTTVIRAALSPVGDALRALKDALVTLTPVIRTVFMWSLLQVAKVLAYVAGFLQGLFGKANLQFPNTARGAGIREASQFGDVNSAIEAMNLAALSGASVEQEQLEIQKEMRDWLIEINKAITSAQASGAALGASAALPAAHAGMSLFPFFAGWSWFINKK